MRSKKDARNQKGSKAQKYQLVKDSYMEGKSSGKLENVAEMKNIKCNRCKYETVFPLFGLSFIYPVRKPQHLCWGW
jgi:hypothetical protein